MAAQQGAGKKGSRKVGANSRRAAAWWKDGGPSRSARAKAKAHGCNQPIFHSGEKGQRDQQHSKSNNPPMSRSTVAAEHHGCGQPIAHSSRARRIEHDRISTQAVRAA